MIPIWQVILCLSGVGTSAIITLTILLVGKFILDGNTEEEIFRRRTVYLLGFLAAGFIFAVVGGVPLWALFYQWQPVVFIVLLTIIIVMSPISWLTAFPLGFWLHDARMENGLFFLTDKSGRLLMLFCKFKREATRIILSTSTIWGAVQRVLTGRKRVILTEGTRQEVPMGLSSINAQKISVHLFLLQRLEEMTESERKPDETSDSLKALFRKHLGVELELAYVAAEDLDKVYLQEVENQLDRLDELLERSQKDLVYWRHVAKRDIPIQLLQLYSVLPEAQKHAFKKLFERVKELGEKSRKMAQQTQAKTATAKEEGASSD